MVEIVKLYNLTMRRADPDSFRELGYDVEEEPRLSHDHGCSCGVDRKRYVKSRTDDIPDNSLVLAGELPNWNHDGFTSAIQGQYRFRLMMTEHNYRGDVMGVVPVASPMK